MPRPRCRFEYLYRDTGNYKGRGWVVVWGEATAENEARIRAALIERSWFLAELVGVPTLYDLVRGDAEPDDEEDHGWHEFVGLGEVEVGDGKAIMSIEVMMMRVHSVMAHYGYLGQPVEG